jgi:predicted transcriptional regulator
MEISHHDTSVAVFRTMKSTKAMTIRLSTEQADALETVASVEQRAVSDVIRAAIAEHIEGRRRDPDFQRGLQARIDRVSRLIGDTRRTTED